MKLLVRVHARETEVGKDGVMQVLKCALGVLQRRGHKVVDPGVVSIGPNEADYLARHVAKVRATVGSGGRSLFDPGAITPGLLQTLRTTSSDVHYTAKATSLAHALGRAMKTSTNAKDCVFAVVRAIDDGGADPHVTILKLDAVVEAARMKQIARGGVTFEVLRDLLPEPGKLQKALSWPDSRSSSDVIMLDTNVNAAQYFELAYQVHVSPRSVEAEEELLRILSTELPRLEVSKAVEDAAGLSGPMDEVLETLSNTYPTLGAVAAATSNDLRPAGIVRENKIAARQIVWRAEGMELRVSPALASNVSATRTSKGSWILSVETPDEPTIS